MIFKAKATSKVQKHKYNPKHYKILRVLLVCVQVIELDWTQGNNTIALAQSKQQQQKQQ